MPPTIAGKVKPFRYRDNSGGVNLRDNESVINQGESKTEYTYLQNVELYRGGGLVGQKGNTVLNTGVTDLTAITGIGQFFFNNAYQIVYTKASGKAYVLPITGGAEGSPIKTGLSTIATTKFIQFNGVVIAFNGADIPWQYDGGTTANLSNTPAGWVTTKPDVAAVQAGTRLFAAAGSTLYYCALGNQNDWTTANDAGRVTDLYSDTARIVNLETYGAFLAIHTQSNKIYLLSGSRPPTATPSANDYAVAPVASNRSAIGRFAIATINNFQFFFSGDAILPLRQTQLNQIQLGSDQDISYKIKPFFDSQQDEIPLLALNPAKKIDTILLPYYNRNEMLAYFKTSGSDVYDTAGIFNFDKPSWTYRKATSFTMVGRIDLSSGVDYIVGGTADGLLVREFYGTAPTGLASFNRVISSPWFDFGDPYLPKKINRFYLIVKTNAQVDFTINIRFDYDPTIVKTDTLPTGVGLSLYGTGLYGVATYGGPSTYRKDYPIDGWFRTMQIEIQCAALDVDFRLLEYGFDVEYANSHY